MSEPRLFWKPVPLSQLKTASEGIEWIWEGILARSRITLLSAQAKAGKTTLLSLLVRQMGQGGSLLGCNVSLGNVIIVTEESDQDWIIRRDNLGLGDHVEAICLPFITKPRPLEWLDLLRQGYMDIQARKPDLIVFDTLSHLWPVEDENNNGEMQEALMPLRGMSQLGPAILLFHHVGAAGSRSRGATELEGFADQIAQLDLTTPTDPANRNRRLTVRGRLTSSPERLEISLNQEGDDYQVLTGNLKPIRSSIWASIVKLIPTGLPGITARELRGAWHEGKEVPSENTILNTLFRCADKAGVRRTDERPARWWNAN
jgi:hypothetical protein